MERETGHHGGGEPPATTGQCAHLGMGGRMWAHGERETERQTGNPARRRREAGDRAADG